MKLGFSELPDLNRLEFGSIKRLHESVALSLLGCSAHFTYDTYSELVYLEEIKYDAHKKTYEFIFKNDCCYSDSSPLNPKDWADSILRNQKLGTGIHFNPSIELDGPPVVKGRSVFLKAHEPSPGFVRLTGKTESSVLHPSYLKATGSDHFTKAPSSGPYRCESFAANDRMILRKNMNFLGQHAITQPESLTWQKFASDELLFEALFDGYSDFIFPRSPVNQHLADPATKGYQALEMFSQTYILTPLIRNLESIGSEYQTPSTRIRLGKWLRANLGKPSWLTQTLLQSDGLGRLSDDVFSTSVQRPKKFSLAFLSTPMTNLIVDALLDTGLEIDVINVSNFDDLFSTTECEFALTWSDYSAFDPYIALYNGINKERPMIADQDGALALKLNSIQATKNSAAKDALYKELHSHILKDAMCIPLAKCTDRYYANDKVDFSNMLGFCFWMLKNR